MSTLATQKITPFLWFEKEAGEAAEFYVSVFKNSQIISKTVYPDHIPVLGGRIMTIEFSIEGQTFVALNGGPQFKFTPAVSFVINCKDQHEIDYFWEKLSEGGAADQCGWLRDKFGLSWQVVPENLPDLLRASPAAMNALMKMKKIVISDLK